MDEVIVEYTSKSPTRAISRDIVKQISANRGISEAKIRSILVSAGVYVSLPRDKGKIELVDEDLIINVFRYHENRSSCFVIDQICKDFGYGKWTVSQFWGSWTDVGCPHTAKQMRSLIQQRSDARRQEITDAMNKDSHHQIAKLKHEAKTREREIKRQIAFDNRFHTGIFSPLIFTSVICIFLFAMTVVAIKSIFS